MLRDLILDQLYPHLGVVAAPVWVLGALIAARRRPRGRAALVAFVCLAMIYGLLASVGLWRGPLSEWLSSVRGVQLRAQWLGLTAILAAVGAGGGRATGTPWRSALALPLLMHQGAAALAAGVVIAGLGLLEPGRPRRASLGLGLTALIAAWVTETWSLDLWIQLGRHLSADGASAVVDLGEQLLRALGWLGVLAWALPARPRSRRPAPPMADSDAARSPECPQ
ncbi:MAG: hypothetical protein H6741_21610 [Alphaproteobacteria bacterium]|nr:hypothetical protein [Alphaproteobacteria bacterium]MCB9795309.1 hypothetical protein [Alphaproteobacteria bacterium]